MEFYGVLIMEEIKEVAGIFNSMAIVMVIYSSHMRVFLPDVDFEYQRKGDVFSCSWRYEITCLGDGTVWYIAGNEYLYIKKNASKARSQKKRLYALDIWSR